MSLGKKLVMLKTGFNIYIHKLTVGHVTSQQFVSWRIL